MDHEFFYIPALLVRFWSSILNMVSNAKGVFCTNRELVAQTISEIDHAS